MKLTARRKLLIAPFAAALVVGALAGTSSATTAKPKVKVKAPLTLTFSQPCANTGTKPAIKHVINVQMENQSYGDLTGVQVSRADGSGNKYTAWPTQPFEGGSGTTPGLNVEVPRSGADIGINGHGPGEAPDWWYSPNQFGVTPVQGSSDTNATDDPNPLVSAPTWGTETGGIAQVCGLSTQFAGGLHHSTGNYFMEAQGSYPDSTQADTSGAIVKTGAYNACSTVLDANNSINAPCTTVAANYNGNGYSSIPTGDGNIYKQLDNAGKTWHVYQQEPVPSSNAGATNLHPGNCAVGPPFSANIDTRSYENRDIVKFYNQSPSTSAGYIGNTECAANDIGVGVDSSGNTLLDQAVGGASGNPFYEALQHVDTSAGIASYVQVVPDLNQMSEACGIDFDASGDCHGAADVTNPDGSTSNCAQTADTGVDRTNPSLKQCRQRNADNFVRAVLSYIWQSPQYQAGNTVVMVTYDEGSGYADQWTDCQAPAGQDGTPSCVKGAANSGLGASVASFPSTGYDNNIPLSGNAATKNCDNSYLRTPGKFCTMFPDDYNNQNQYGIYADWTPGAGENCAALNSNYTADSGANLVGAKYQSCWTPFLIMYPFTPAGTNVANNSFSNVSILRGVEDTFGLAHLGLAGDNTCGGTGTQACWGSWKGLWGT